MNGSDIQNFPTCTADGSKARTDSLHVAPSTTGVSRVGDVPTVSIVTGSGEPTASAKESSTQSTAIKTGTDNGTFFEAVEHTNTLRKTSTDKNNGTD